MEKKKVSTAFLFSGLGLLTVVFNKLTVNGHKIIALMKNECIV